MQGCAVESVLPHRWQQGCKGCPQLYLSHWWMGTEWQVLACHITSRCKAISNCASNVKLSEMISFTSQHHQWVLPSFRITKCLPKNISTTTLSLSAMADHPLWHCTKTKTPSSPCFQISPTSIQTNKSSGASNYSQSHSQALILWCVVILCLLLFFFLLLLQTYDSRDGRNQKRFPLGQDCIYFK